MKLHLPKGLKAALLATFTVLAASWSHQGYAAELTKVITMSQMAQEATITDGATLSTTWEMTDGVVYDFGGSGYLGGIANTDLLNALKGDDYVTVAAWIHPSSHAAGTGGGDGGSLFGYGAQGDGIKVIDKDGALKATTKNVADFTTSAVGIDLNTWQLVAVTMHRNNGKLDVYYMLDGVYSSVVTGGAPNAASTDSFAIGSGNSESPRELYQGSIGNMIVFTSTEMVTVTDVTSQMGTAPTKIPGLDLIWNGPAPTAAWDFTSTNWLKAGSPSTFETGPGITVTFGTGTAAKTVTINETIDAGEVVVSDNYTFTADSSSSLMVDTLNVADGKTATLAGEGYFSVNQLGGAISIAEGAAVNVGGTFTLSATQTLPVSGEGKLVATTLKVTGGEHTITNALEVRGGGDGKGGTNRSLGLVVTGGTVTLEGATHITGALYAQVGTVNIGNGTDAVRVETNRVEFGDTAGSGTSTLNVKKNATLHVMAGDEANAYASTGLVMGEWGGVSVANISGKLYADQATAYVGDNTVTFNIESGGLMAVKGFSQNQHKDAKTETINLNLLDGGTVVLGANGIASQKPVNINFAAGEVGISEYAVEIAKDVTLSGSGTTFNTSVYEWSGSDDTLELQEGLGGGSLTISGNITGDGTILKEGEGTLVLSGGGNVLTHTITANNGNLTLSGGFEIGDIASVGETTYANGQHAGNGYATATGDITVYTGTSTVDDSQAVYTYHGAVVSVSGGKYALPGEQDNTTYYINAGTDSFNWIDTNKPGELTGGIVVKEGATLQADKDMSMAEVAAASKGTVQIDEGVVVSSNGGSQHVALTGTGTYALQGGVQTLGSVDASGFNGWVRLSGALTDINLDGNLQDTNVEFSGASGYFKNVDANTEAVFNGDLHLQDAGAGTPAITVNNGYSRDSAYLVFTGAVSGSGTWELALGATQHYAFSGDISAWDGTFHVTNSGSGSGGTSINFRNDANTVNAIIARQGGTLRLFAETDVTFNKAVTGASSLTVSDGKTATFATNEDSSIIGGVSGAGTLVKNGTGTLTVSGTPYTGTTAAPIPTTATINVNAGTLKATSAGTLGTGDITVGTDATLELTVGNVLGGTQSVANSGNVLLHDTLTSGAVNGGILTLAGDFPTSGDILDVDDQDTGNGFSRGGSIKVFDPTKASLSVTEIKRGDSTYHMDDLVEGAITLSGADWSTYQMNTGNLNQPTLKAIMDYADAQSGTADTLRNIVVNGEDLYLMNDSTKLKASMLSGSAGNLSRFTLMLTDGSITTMDADLATPIMVEGSDGGAASAVIVLEKDAAATGGIWALTQSGGASTLTVKGAHTFTTPEMDITHGSLVLEEGAKFSTDVFAPAMGDSVMVKDTAEFAVPGVSIKSVDGTKDAVLKMEAEDTTGEPYEIGKSMYSLTDARITLNFSAAHNIGHELKGTVALVNAGTASVNDTNAANTVYDELYAQKGSIYLSGKDSVSVRDLTVGDGLTVGGTTTPVSITVDGEATFGSGSKLGTALTMAGGSTLNGKADLQNHALSLEKGVVIGDDLWSSLKTLTPLSTTTLFTGVSDFTLAGSVFSNPVDLTTVFTNAELKPKKYTLSFAGGNVVITKEMENNRYWKSGSGTWDNTSVVWTDEDGSGTDVKFESGYNAHFTVNGGGGTITVEEAVNVASVNVSGAKYDFTNAEMLNITNGIDVSESGSATFSKLADKELGTIGIGSGSTMLVTEGNVAVQTFSNEGNLTVRGGSLTVKNATAKGGNVEVTNLTLAGENTFGTVMVSGTVSGATSIKVGGTSRITTLSGVNTLTLTDGTLTLGTTSGLNATTLSGALTAGPGVDLGSVTMNGGSSIKGNGAVTASGVSVTGTADILGGTLQTASVGGTGTLKIASGSTVGGSNLSVADKATLELLEGSTLDNSGTLSVVGKVIAGNGINLGEVAATGTVEVNGASVSATGGSIATLDIGAGETLAVAGDLALTGTAGTAGVLTVGGGLTVNGVVTLTDVTAGTLELANSGTLTATGTLDAGSITLRRVSKTEAYLTAGTLSDTTTDFVVDKQLVWDLGAQTGQVITLAYVDSAYAGAENLTINGVKSISDKNRHSYTIMQDATSHDIILKVEDQESGFVWTGNEDTLWSHTGNWSNLTVPGEEDWVQVKGDTHTIELDGNPSVAYFTVSAQSATLQGEHTLAVGSELEVNMNATLYVGDASTPTAIVAPTATINGTLVVQPGSSVQADTTTITGGTLNVNDATYTAETIDMTEGALRTSPDAYVVTGQLNGDIDSIVGGHVIIASTGSRFTGGYDDAYIDIAEDAEAVLYAGEGLTLGGNGTAKLRYSGSTAIDGIDADELTIVLNNPNTSLIGSTLTLQDESGLTNGTLEFGMSAIESAKSIGSALAPQIIEGSLVLGDGTTVVVNQDALADSGIAMAVYNGNARRNLALAYIGNEETDTKSVQLNGYLYGKYYKNARIEDGKLLVDMRDDFYQDLVNADTENGRAGAGMLDDALLYVNPQVTNPDGDLAAVMTALETGAIPQGSADRVTAAMSGASHAAMGAAWSHDVDRQLRAIRNRTTQMGMADCVVNEDLPYFNAWINAEGGYSKMNADSTLAGYKLSSWGGTLGVDVDLTPRFTFGAAVTAMSGDFTADSAETAEGDLDRMYVTVFGRYSRRAWSHTLVATYGMADTNLKRTVNYGTGSYTAESDSDGTAFGVMYEVGYAAALNEDASTCLQPVLNLSYRHSSLDGSREKGRSDAALKLGDAEANVFTVALGARLQSTVGTSVYNRATLFEGRVLCKVDTGDRDVAASNSFTGIGHGRDAKSAEMGLFGLEVGAGITIPVAERGGAVFLDVTGEFRAKYTEVNGTVGYRFNF